MCCDNNAVKQNLVEAASELLKEGNLVLWQNATVHKTLTLTKCCRISDFIPFLSLSLSLRLILLEMQWLFSLQ